MRNKLVMLPNLKPTWGNLKVLTDQVDGLTEKDVYARSFTPSPRLVTEVPKICYKNIKETYESRPKSINSRVFYHPKVIKLTERSRMVIYELKSPKKPSIPTRNLPKSIFSQKKIPKSPKSRKT